jgi:putative DNA primase/helicase
LPYASIRPASGSAQKEFEADPITDADIAFYAERENAQEDIGADKPGMGHNSGVIFTDTDKVAVRNVDYVWKGRLARGKHTLFAGEAGEGKSQIMAYIAARISKGEAWPAQGYTKNPEKAPQGYVIILSAEDDPEDTLVPRLIAAGADLKFVKILKAVKGKDGARKFNLETDR